MKVRIGGPHLLVLGVIMGSNGGAAQTPDLAIAKASAFCDLAGIDFVSPHCARSEMTGMWDVSDTVSKFTITSDGAHLLSYSGPMSSADVELDRSETLRVTSDEDAWRVAEDWLRRCHLPVYDRKRCKPEKNSKGDLAFGYLLAFEERAPGGYKGMVNHAILEVLAHDGRISNYSTLPWFTYDDPVIVLTESGAIDRLRARVKAVHGVDLTSGRTTGPFYGTDLEVDAIDYSNRGPLSDQQGPPRGGRHRSRLVYMVFGEGSDRGYPMSYYATVDAKDGTVMDGDIDTSKSGGRRPPPVTSVGNLQVPLAVAALMGAGIAAISLVRRRRA